jgi:hypothetical protein
MYVEYNALNILTWSIFVHCFGSGRTSHSGDFLYCENCEIRLNESKMYLLETSVHSYVFLSPLKEVCISSDDIFKYFV